MSDEVPGLGYSIIHAPGQELHTLSAGDVGLPESSVALKSRFLKASDSRGLIADQEPPQRVHPGQSAVPGHLEDIVLLHRIQYYYKLVCCPWPPCAAAPCCCGAEPLMRP